MLSEGQPTRGAHVNLKPINLKPINLKPITAHLWSLALSELKVSVSASSKRLTSKRLLTLWSDALQGLTRATLLSRLASLGAERALCEPCLESLTERAPLSAPKEELLALCLSLEERSEVTGEPFGALLGRCYEQLIGCEPQAIRGALRGALKSTTKGSEAPAYARVGGSVSESARAQSASFYTPSWVVAQALEESLKPLSEACRGEGELLALSALDPSCGGGAFLLGALHSLSARLCELQSGVQDAPQDTAQDPPQNTAQALLSVAERCLYGVDVSPQAVELTRLTLFERVASAFAQEQAQERAEAQPLEPELQRALRGLAQRLQAHVLCADALTFAPKKRRAQTSNATERPLWCERLRAHAHEGHQAERSPLERGGFSVVIGNPPYIDSERMSKAQPKLRERLSERFESCVGNWDLYIPFVELSLRLLSPQGRLALVLPRQVMSAGYAAGLQALLLRQEALKVIDYGELELFEGASVRALTLIVSPRPTSSAQGAPQGAHLNVSVVSERSQAPKHLRRASAQALKRLPKGHWGVALSQREGVSERLSFWERAAPLSSIAKVSDGATTSEAYELKALLQEQGELKAAQPYVKLINTGLIDPFELLWGERPLVYLKSAWQRPVLEARALEALLPRRFEQAMSPKVVVAGLSLKLEAAVAPAGVLCGKSAKQLLPIEGVCPYALCAWLNSPLIVSLYHDLFAGRGMGKALSVGRLELEQLPVPRVELLRRSEASLVTSSAEALAKSLQAVPLEERLSALGQALHRSPRCEVGGGGLRELITSLA